MRSESPESYFLKIDVGGKMNQGFWAAEIDGSFNEDEASCDSSSRAEPKRSHQLFADGPQLGLFPNKRQALGVPNTTLLPGMLNPNSAAWGHGFCFNPFSSRFSEWLFAPEGGKNGDLEDRNTSSVGLDKLSDDRKLDESPYGNDSSSSFSLSPLLEDPRLGLNYEGIHKANVCQVKGSEGIVPASLEHGYESVGNNVISTSHSFSNRDNDSMSLGPGYSKVGTSGMTSRETYDNENNIFISMRQPYCRMNGKSSSNQAYKDDKCTIGMVPAFRNGDLSLGSQYFSRSDEKPMLVGDTYNEVNGSDSVIAQTYSNSDNGSISMGLPCSRGESTIISFGGYNDTDANARLISSYELFASQPSFHMSAANSEDLLVNSSVDMLVTDGHAVSAGTANDSRKKDDLKTSKKASSNSFPSNVRSLLSTGMLDGVSVKYIAWSREKELRGIIKGTGYLCGCQTCNFSKVVNAYEFERHANCKTKHPNNHIYCESGKTIYGIVQELRSTPQNMLFDVMQTITGSPINQKSFHLWKESFQAATLELQRIYPKE